MDTCAWCGKEVKKNLRGHQLFCSKRPPQDGMAALPHTDTSKISLEDKPAVSASQPVYAYHSMISPSMRELMNFKMEQAMLRSFERDNAPPQQPQINPLDSIKLFLELQKATPNMSISEVMKAFREMRDFQGEITPSYEDNPEDKLLSELLKSKMGQLSTPVVQPVQQPQQNNFTLGDAMDIKNYLPLIQNKIQAMSDDEFMAIMDLFDDFIQAEIKRRGIKEEPAQPAPVSEK